MRPSSVNFPNLFIVGAPKCGTTSLHGYLGQHPDIFMAEPKEPYYFLSDMPHQERFDEKAYMALFANAGEVQYAGEASVWYLYSSAAASNIRDFCPRARIIIMLRNPADLLYSLHHRSLHTANEDIFDFEEALAAEPERRQRRRIPATAYFPDGLCYRQVVDFVPQVRRYLDAFGRSSVRIVLFDDFVNDTAGVYRDTLTWLNVDDDFEPDLTRRNVSRPLPNLALQRFLRRNAMMRAFRSGMRALVPQPVITGIQAAIGKYTQRQQPARLDPALRARLLQDMRADIEALGELIERDLSLWYGLP